MLLEHLKLLLARVCNGTESNFRRWRRRWLWYGHQRIVDCTINIYGYRIAYYNVWNVGYFLFWYCSSGS